MTNPIARILVVMTMLVAFIGQAFAYTTMHCNMSKTSHEQNMTMDHSSMAHSSMEHSAMTSMHTNEEIGHGLSSEKHSSEHDECCGISCSCPANACSSITFINSQNYSLKIEQSLEVISNPNAIVPNSNLKSLYRPPIFA